MNFDERIWTRDAVNDVPLLTKFIFGAWLYPTYLAEKSNDKDLDYVKFLIKHGFYYTKGIPEYSKYKEYLSSNFATLAIGESNNPDALVNRYGNTITLNLSLIQKVRQLNSILLAGSVVTLFLFFKKRVGSLFSLTFTLLYAYNSLILSTGLMAHSEAIFLLLFNISLVILYKHLFETRSLKTLIYFAIFAGMCFATKLNGIMLYFIYVMALIFRMGKLSKKTLSILGVLRVILPPTIIVIIFVLFNPQVFSSPIRKIFDMFMYRQGTVLVQTNLFSNAALSGLGERVSFIANSFLNNYFLSKENPFETRTYIAIMAILFITGLGLEIKRSLKKNNLSVYLIFSFLISFLTTISYLQLAWQRYLVHLTLFFVYYQTVGFFFFTNFVKKTFFVQNKNQTANKQ
jgi:hypothetical protein